MQVRPTRRALLQLAAGLFAGPAFGARAGETPTLKTRARLDTGNATLNPPAFGDRRIVYCGDRTAGATDAAGKALWRIDLPDGRAAHFRPRLANDLALIGGRGGLVALDPETGETLWRRGAAIQTGVPALAGELACFGDGHEIVAVEARTGKERWRFAGVPDTLGSYAPAIAGDVVLAGPGDGRLYALSAVDGSLLWKADRSAEWQYLRQLHVHEGILVAGSYKEKLFGVSIADGKPLWEFNAGNFINSHHVADGAAYLWSPTGFIYAVDAASGKVRWRHETTDYDETHGNWASLMAELVTADGKLFALAMDDVLHVLSTGDGAEAMRYAVGAKARHAVLPLGENRFAFPLTDGSLLLAEAA